ncbi:MAG: sigma factor [Candidatus Woesearchaeota archaeon]
MISLSDIVKTVPDPAFVPSESLSFLDSDLAAIFGDLLEMPSAPLIEVIPVQDALNFCLNDIIRNRVRSNPQHEINGRLYYLKTDVVHLYGVDFHATPSELAKKYEGFRRTIASRFLHILNLPECDLSDLMQEGSIGLLLAIKQFDPAYGTQLSGYVYDKMYRTIQSAANGVYSRWTRHKWYAHWSTEKKLELMRGYNPDATLEEFAEQEGMDVDKCRKILGSKPSFASLDAPIDVDDSSHTLHDHLPDPSSKVDMDYVEIHTLLSKAGLSNRVIEIIYKRYFCEQYLKDIGTSLDSPISKERVRQLLVGSLDKLKSIADELNHGL